MNYANRMSYSDITPYEIVRHISAKTIEVREMEYILDPAWKPEVIPGGFLGHCVNQRSQTYTYASDASRDSVRLRQHKNGMWYDADGNKFMLAEQPVRFYDYNF